jgi:hypothetical protein
LDCTFRRGRIGHGDRNDMQLVTVALDKLPERLTINCRRNEFVPTREYGLGECSH